MSTILSVLTIASFFLASSLAFFTAGSTMGAGGGRWLYCLPMDIMVLPTPWRMVRPMVAMRLSMVFWTGSSLPPAFSVTCRMSGGGR